MDKIIKKSKQRKERIKMLHDNEKTKVCLVVSDEGNILFSDVPQLEKPHNIIVFAKNYLKKKGKCSNILHNIKYFKNRDIDKYISKKFADEPLNPYSNSPIVPFTWADFIDWKHKEDY